MHPASNLPHDVWEVVAHLLPRKELFRLISVNRAFYDIVLDERYREILWVKLDNETLRYLGRLQDSCIARRVRRLHIRAWFIHYLLQREALFRASYRQLCLRNFFQKFFSLNFDLFGVCSLLCASKTSCDPPVDLSSIEEVMKAMVRAVEGMVNVTEYNFEWRDLPLNRDTHLFLTTARAAFNSTLRKLVLHAQISRFVQLLSITDFEGLEELEFCFDFDAGHSDPREDPRDHNAAILVSCVAPFINYLSPSLRSLTITSMAKGDHSAFFQAIGTLPALRHFALRMAFEAEYISDASGIHRVLRDHTSTLVSVELKPTRSRASTRTTLPFFHVMKGMLHDYLSDYACLRSLESLSIPTLDQRTTVILVSRSASTLRRLHILDRFLHINEVAQIVSIFAGNPYNLIDLHLEVCAITKRLLNVLSIGFPMLQSLTLVVEDDNVCCLFSIPGSLLLTDQPNSIVANLQITELQCGPDRPYLDWKLYDLSLFIGHHRHDPISVLPRTRDEDKLMATLARYLPNVGSFKSRGHRRVWT